MSRLEEAVQARHVLDIVEHRAGNDFLDETGQGSAWTDLDKGIDTQLLKPANRLGPADRPGELADHQPPNLHWLRVDLGVAVEDLPKAQRLQRNDLPGHGEVGGR